MDETSFYFRSTYYNIVLCTVRLWSLNLQDINCMVQLCIHCAKLTKMNWEESSVGRREVARKAYDEIDDINRITEFEWNRFNRLLQALPRFYTIHWQIFTRCRNHFNKLSVTMARFSSSIVSELFKILRSIDTQAHIMSNNSTTRPPTPFLYPPPRKNGSKTLPHNLIQFLLFWKN